MVIVKCWMKIKASAAQELHVPLTSTVRNVKVQCSNLLGMSPNCPDDLEIVYCGRRLSNDSVLSDCSGLREHCTVHLLRRKREDRTPATSTIVDPSAIEALVTSFQTALMDVQHRTLLFSIISNSEGLSNLISATPGLKEDTVAQGILKDPYLLMQWLTSENVKELILNHPCLVEAGQQIMSSLHQEASGFAADPAVLFEQQSEDEETSENEADDAGSNFPDQQEAGAAVGPITAGQLAAALAAAGATTGNVEGGSGGSDVPPQDNSELNRRPTASAGETTITADMFHQALVRAFAAGQNNSASQQVDANAIRQLTDMGFTDEEENRRALVATGGNFEAALEYIISERERMEHGMDLD